MLSYSGPHMSKSINFKGLDALIALLKDFMVALPAKNGSHICNLTLVSHSKRVYLASLPIRSWPTWQSRECHSTDSVASLPFSSLSAKANMIAVKNSTISLLFRRN